MGTPTLAEKLGTTVHLSPLLHRARKLGLGKRELEILAVQRGCRHYSDGSEPQEPLASEEEFSNEDLAVALLSICLPYDPHTIRCGAAMLGANGNDPQRLAWMAKLERSEIPVRYVAEAGRKFEPNNQFWEQLLCMLPDTPAPKPGVMPHPTRFVAMTGLTQRGREFLTQWVRAGLSAIVEHGNQLPELTKPL
jgi:hypothetical protein